MNSNAEVPVQMVMSDLNTGQPMQNENVTHNSSTQSSAVIHSTMTMAQSPLQQQMQAIQQNLNANSAGSVQMVMSELNTQVQMVQNENIAHSGSSSQTTLMHPTVTMAQAPMQHVQVIPQAMSSPYFQSLQYSPQQQVIFPGNLTLHAGGSPVVQSIAQNPNVQLQAKPELLNKVSVTGPTYQIVNAVTSKAFPNQNVIAKPLYTSSIPVNSPTQVSNANQLKQMTSQPQMITTQASGAIYQPQVFSSFAQLPQNITWATPGTYQSPTLLSANVIIRNQHPEMFLQPSPQTTMIMPVASGTTQLPGGFTYALVQPQKTQQITQKHMTIPQTHIQKSTKVRNISPSVATQTNTNEKMKIPIPRTRVNQNIRAKGKIAVPFQYNTAISSILPHPQQVTNDAQLQNQVQLGFQLESDIVNQTSPNLTKSVTSTGTDSPILQNQLVGSEIPQPIQHLPSKPEVISAPPNVAQTTNCPINKPVAMVIASTVNTTTSVNSVVSSPTFLTPVLTPVISSIETPVTIPICPPVSSSVLNNGTVLDSSTNSPSLPDTNDLNEKNTSATLSETQDNICSPKITNHLKPTTYVSAIDQRMDISTSDSVANSCEQTNAAIPNSSQTQVVSHEQKIVDILRSQTCNLEQQMTLPVSKSPVSQQKNIYKSKLEARFNNCEVAVNALKTQEQAKTTILRSDVLVPETHSVDCAQEKDEQEKTEFNLDIIIKKEPAESSSEVVEKDAEFNNFKKLQVIEKEVVINKADSSATVSREYSKQKVDSQHNVLTGPVQHPLKSLLTYENKVVTPKIELKSKTVKFESQCNVTAENKFIKNQSSCDVKATNKFIENKSCDKADPVSKTENIRIDLKDNKNAPLEPRTISKEIDKKECDELVSKNLKSELILQKALSEEQSDTVSESVMSTSPNVCKQKERLKAIVRPHILTHYIDGFVIHESSEPFPVHRPSLMSESFTPEVVKMTNNSKKLKGSKHLAIKNPDEPTKPDLKQSNEPTKTDFPKKRSDRIKLLETQKQLDLKKSEPKKPSDTKKAVEPKTPNDLKKTTEPKIPTDLKKVDEPKKIEDTEKIGEANKINDLSSNDVKNEVAISDNVPKTPGRRGRKRKELRSRRGRKKLIPDIQLNNSQIEIIVLDGENGPESDIHEDEAVSSIETTLPVQTATEDEAAVELKSPAQIVENSSPKPSTSGKMKEIEDDKAKTFSEKLPTEWSVEDVCDFVRNIPNCHDYAEEFKSQEIDGKALLLLKVDHIVTFTSMKFGPALKLISLIDDMKEKYSLEV